MSPVRISYLFTQLRSLLQGHIVQIPLLRAPSQGCEKNFYAKNSQPEKKLQRLSTVYTFQDTE